jgi:excisionase family DNA binding protein
MRPQKVSALAREASQGGSRESIDARAGTAGDAERLAMEGTKLEGVGGSVLLDVLAVAALLSSSRRTVERLVARGEMPAPVKLGRLRRWNRADVEEWIRDGCGRVRSRKGGAR